MSNMNRVLLVGRLVRDPKLSTTTTTNATHFTNFSMAVNRTVADKCDFFDCVAFNKKAEVITKYCHKGDIIGIDGRLQTRSYESTSGGTVKKVEVVVDNVSFFPRNTQAPQPPQIIKEEDLPF